MGADNEKVSSPLYAAMLDGSTALVNSDGVLEITPEISCCRA
ncbi:MAG: hypothetical protein ACLSG5_02185 [Oscillospiraceae bacterium]